MICEPWEMAFLAELFEQFVEEGEGWDANPLLVGVAYDPTQDPDKGRLNPFPLPFPIGVTGNPVKDLHYLASNLGYADLDQMPAMVHELVDENFAGLMFICEGWGITATTEERTRITGSLKHVPGAVENRIVTAVDTSGRRYQVRRNRGKGREPLAYCDFDGTMRVAPDNEVQLTGNVMAAVTIAVRGLCRLISPDAYALPALPPLDKGGVVGLVEIFEEWTGMRRPA